MTEQKKQKGYILMADDDEEYYSFTELALKEMKSDVGLRRVEDGEELMDYLLHREKYKDLEASEKPALIFLDLNMPRKNGLEALKEIKTSTALRQIPVIMLTISNNKEEIKLSYFLGANSFLTKPLNFDALVKALKSVQDYWFDTVRLPGL